jgi:hypothetical protein
MNLYSFSNSQANQKIPNWLIWFQCVAFMVLYGFWILPEIVGFRNTALVVGALAGLYPIYQYRSHFLQKRAIPIWLIVGLFAWATFHLLFLSQDYALQLLEFKRIWKYAALGAIFALGLGLSLANASLKDPKAPFWAVIYLGLCLPVLTYLLKYTLTTYGAYLGIQTPPYLQIYFGSTAYYVPKTDYVAFCLPVLAISLGQMGSLLTAHSQLKLRQYMALAAYLGIIAATLFLFYIQNIKNGMAHATLCMALFAALLFIGYPGRWWRKGLVVVAVITTLATALYPHIQQNQTWRTLIADTQVAFQLDQYPQWKYAGEQGYPNNEFGTMVSITNYERAAWFKVGVKLALQTPLGYGLVEDSFKKMAKSKWPEASPNLSHSHSGWLDVILAVGFPGFFCILGALMFSIMLSRTVLDPWRPLIFWSLVSNLLLWVTTEVSATVSFATLIFWICWASGLSLIRSNPKIPSE